MGDRYENPLPNTVKHEIIPEDKGIKYREDTFLASCEMLLNQILDRLTLIAIESNGSYFKDAFYKEHNILTHHLFRKHSRKLCSRYIGEFNKQSQFT